MICKIVMNNPCPPCCCQVRNNPVAIPGNMHQLGILYFIISMQAAISKIPIKIFTVLFMPFYQVF